MKIVVLAGGLSNERNISLSSGTLIANALIDNGHEVRLLDLYLGSKSVDNLFTKEKYEYILDENEPDLDSLKKENNNLDNYIGENILEICKKADIVFIALHGSIGENGKLQALFDIYNIKYTGSGYQGSLISMDKDLTKQILKLQGISTAKWITVADAETNIDLNYPLVVKPLDNGSSVGVFITNDKNELKDAIIKAQKLSDRVLVEEYIKGREFSVGIIDNQVLPPIEIIPKKGFYDYKNKYVAGLTEELCPTDLNAKQLKELEELSAKVYQVLRIEVYGRIDFILSENDNKFYCLEANTLPGMTPTSLMPQEAKVIGINFLKLCEKIISKSLEKYDI